MDFKAPAAQPSSDIKDSAVAARRAARLRDERETFTRLIDRSNEIQMEQRCSNLYFLQKEMKIEARGVGKLGQVRVIK